MSKINSVPWTRTTPQAKPEAPRVPPRPENIRGQMQYFLQLQRQRQLMRLVAASRIAQRALVRLKPVIYNAMTQRELEKTPNRKLSEIPNEKMPAINDARQKIMDTRGATAGIKHLTQATMQTPTDKMRYMQGIKLQNKGIKSKGGAQCGELSEYVFHRCYKEGLFPVHQILAENVNLLNNPNDNHAFVAIGLRKPGKQSDMANWPDDVVICDPWVMELIRGTAQDTTSNRGAYTIPQYLNLVRNYFAQAGKVYVTYGHDSALGVSINPVIGGARVAFGTQGIYDRSRPEYQNGYKFGADVKRGLYPAKNTPIDWWQTLIAAKGRPDTYQFVGLPDPPDFSDPYHEDLWYNCEAGCKAGYANS